MKKTILTMLMCAVCGATFAQMTPEEKAAQKAAQAALKAAEKEAKAEVNKAVKLYNEGAALLVPDPIVKKPRTHEDTLTAMNLFREGEQLLAKALGSGHVAEKQMYEAWLTRKQIANQLMNYNLVKFNKEPFDTVECCQAIINVTTAIENTIKYHKKADETQAQQAKLDAGNVVPMALYMGYRSYFYILMKDIDNAAAALDDYMNYPKRFAHIDPAIADRTPDPSYENLGFNIYLLAYNAKKYDLAEKFYDLASKYDDEQSHNFVLSSRPQMYLLQGDTAKWVKALEDIIETVPNSVNADVAVQNLLAYYGKKSIQSMKEFADKILAKDPNSKMGNYGKGHSLFTEGKFAEALEYFKKSVEIDPDFAEGYNMAGMSLYRLAAENYFTQIDGKKYKTSAEMQAAEEKYVKTYYREAVGFFETCREKVPEQSDMWAGPLQVIYKNLGEKEKAAALDVYTK